MESKLSNSIHLQNRPANRTGFAITSSIYTVLSKFAGWVDDTGGVEEKIDRCHWYGTIKSKARGG